MKNISHTAKLFLSFAFAALLVSATFTGCENKDNSLAPQAASGLHNPTSANSHAANGADLGHAMDVQDRHTDELMTIDGVNGTATGLNEDGNPAVYVFTDHENVHGIPSSIEGVATHVENIGAVKALDVYVGLSRGPVQSGYSVGNDNECASGTISCVVTDNATSTMRYLLSNNHVFARVNAAAIGERIDQPGRYDGLVTQCDHPGQVATLSKFIPINFGKRASNTVDCAIAECTVAAATQNPIYTPSTTTVLASVGQHVKKVGRTTGLQTGTISAINWTGTINYGGRKSAKFTNQVYIQSATFSAAGDSGSLIVTDDANQNPVALLFAGSTNSTIANPIGSVLTSLGVHIVN